MAVDPLALAAGIPLTLVTTEVLIRAASVTRRVGPLLSLLVGVAIMFTMAFITRFSTEFADVLAAGAFVGIVASWSYDLLKSLMGNE